MDVRLYGGIIYAIQINNTLKPPEDKTVNGYTLNINSTKALEIRMKIDNEFYSVVELTILSNSVVITSEPIEFETYTN